MHRSMAGRETWRRLLEWDRGQAAAERLASHVLRMEGFQAVDPSHPLGGPDGLRDVIGRRGSVKWIGAAYFPRGQQSWRHIESKFGQDVQGVAKNNANGLAFVTNQELTLSQRDALAQQHNEIGVDIYHLERIASLLDSPPCYGLRLEFLDIEMTKEEQLSYMAARDVALDELKETVEVMSKRLPTPISRAAPRDIPTVVPKDIGFGSTGMFGNRYVDCKGCAGVFQVQGGFYGSAGTTMFGGMYVVTCPFFRPHAALELVLSSSRSLR